MNASGGALSHGGAGGANTQGGSGTAPLGGSTALTGGRIGAGGGAQPAQGGSANGGATLGGASNGGSAIGGSAVGGTNGGASANQDLCNPAPAGMVSFSVPSGTFETSLSLALSSSVAGAEIRYTTNHQAPSASSTLYSGTPIAISATTEVIAQVFVQGAAAGSPESALYVQRAFDQTHDLPVMVIDTFGKSLPSPNPIGFPGMGSGGSGGADPSAYVHSAFMIYEPSAGSSAALSGAASVVTPAGVHVRGQSSAMYDKKPYRVEFQKVDGSDRDCPVLGMPKESDWVLHSPFPDKALIRNAFVYSLGRDIGMQSPRAKFSELYVNTAGGALQSSHYAGVYLMVETIKNQKERLNLQQLKPKDTALPAVAGGYIFEFQWQVNGIEQQLTCPSGQQNCWKFLEVVDPKPWVPEQQAYLTQFLQSVITAFHVATPSDATTGYPSVIDTPSFVNQVIIQELTRNIDAFCRSQYFYKDRTGKLFAGPLWDYDATFGVGSSTSYPNMSTDGLESETNASRIKDTADWFPILLADPAFKSALVARWKELRQTQLSDTQVKERIATLTSGLANAAKRNFQKWNNLTQVTVGVFQTPTANSWEGQVAAMQEWLLKRMAWLDSTWK